MTNQFQPSEQPCLLIAGAQCNRIWVSQSGGLRLAHFQTRGQDALKLRKGDAAVGVGSARISDSAAYEQCVRGCVGPKL